MTTRHVRLLQDTCKIADATVATEVELCQGSIDLSETPASVLSLFEQFEEAVNQQLFIHLDEIQERIMELNIVARFDDGFTRMVHDLQVFPSTGDFSFRLFPTPSASIRPT